MLLAIDTSTRQTGIALYDGAHVLHEMSWTSQYHHTVELAPAIEFALSRAGSAPADLTALAVALGPGSFTSLRTGLAAAKGMAFAQRLPLIGIPSLDVLAAAQPVSDLPLAAVLEAGRKRLAVGWYRAVKAQWRPKGDVQLYDPQALYDHLAEPALICGELDADLRALLRRKKKIIRLASPAQSQRRPGYLAELAWERWQSGHTDDPITLAPIYLSQDRSV